MYAVGDYIVHPGQGVCRVEEITPEPAACYQLLPITQRHSMRISFPVSGEDRLRPVLSRDEAIRIIDSYPSIEVDGFSAKSSSLEEDREMPSNRVMMSPLMMPALSAGLSLLTSAT